MSIYQRSMNSYNKNIPTPKTFESATRELEYVRKALDRAAIVAITDAKGTIIHVNDKFCAISQYSREELVGQNHRIINSRHHSPEFFSDMWKTISSGNVWEGEIKNRAKDGSYYWVYTTIVPFLDDQGKPYQYVSIRFEITGIKAAEIQLKDYAAKLERSNRELQDFASIAAHDLQEPLRKILTFGDRLRSKCDNILPPDGKDYLERMLSAASRMRTLIDDLLRFARIHTNAQPFSLIDLNSVVSEVLSDLEIRIEQTHAKINISELPQIEADTSQMRQMFQNLISNSIKFHKKDTPPVVHISSATKDGFCLLTVKDNGIGFEEKYTDRIFAIFQRLHGREEYEGTGVGLAVVRRIVERHGGTISAKGSTHEGAEFIIRLPLTQRKDS